MISPKTHPQYYRTIQVFQHKWNAPIWLWNQLTDDVREALREAYKIAKPDELEDGLVNDKKFSAWWVSEETKTRDFYNRAVTKYTCVPVDDAPPLEGEWYDALSAGEVNGIVNFIRPASIGNASAPTVAAANETSTEASGANIPSA